MGGQESEGLYNADLLQRARASGVAFSASEARRDSPRLPWWWKLRSLIAVASAVSSFIYTLMLRSILCAPHHHCCCRQRKCALAQDSLGCSMIVRFSVTL